MKKTSKSSMKKYQTGGVKPYAGGVKPYAGGVTLAGSNKTVKKPNTGQSAPSTVNTSNNRPVQNAPKVTISPIKPKPAVKKPAAKKPANKKPVPKPTYSAVKDLTSRMYPNTGIPASKKPATKTETKSTTKSATKPTYSAVKDIKSRMVPNTLVPKTGVGAKTTTKAKPSTAKPAGTKTVTPAKPAAKTVSQLWVEKTGTPWSEAKKQGFSDGTAASNIALMKKLQSGSPMEYTRAYTGPDYSGDAAAEAAFGEPKTTMKKGGKVKSKKK